MTWTELHELDTITADVLTEKQIPYYLVALAMDHNTATVLLSGVLDNAVASVASEELMQLDCTTKIAEKLEELYDFGISGKTTAIVRLLHENKTR